MKVVRVADHQSSHQNSIDKFNKYLKDCVGTVCQTRGGRKFKVGCVLNGSPRELIVEDRKYFLAELVEA